MPQGLIRTPAVDRNGNISVAWLKWLQESDVSASQLAALNAAIALCEQSANKNSANGYCPLGADSKVPLANLPTSLNGASSGTVIAAQLPNASNKITRVGSGWANTSMWHKVSGCQLRYLVNAFKFRFIFHDCAGISIKKCVICRTLALSQTVLDSTPVTFGGSSSFAGAAGGANPFVVTTDAISLALDVDHDYYVMVYLDDDSASTNYNAHVNLTGSTLGPCYWPSNYYQGDHTADATLTYPSGNTSCLYQMVIA